MISSIILARGGSKGIPNKNLIELYGRPLIYYTIKASILSQVNETWVSTDSDQIAAIAEDYGAKIMLRPAEFSTDTSSSEQALIHFCQNIETDTVVMIQPTSPLLESEDINRGLKLIDDGYDSVFSAYKEHWIPRWTEQEQKLAPYQWESKNRPRRQEKEEMLVENGGFYISSSYLILKNKLRYSGRIGYVEMPFSRSFQIDTYDDLLIVEALMKGRGLSV